MEVEQSVSSHNIFSFQQPRETANRLLNKNIPGVEVDLVSNIVHCKDSQSDPTIVRSQLPLQNDVSLSYFEVEVLEVAAEDSISIGLMAKDNNIKQNPGKNNNSFGYYRGEFFLNKKKIGAITPHEKLQVGDCVGVGINCMKRTMFVVKNGRIIFSNVSIPLNWAEYYPAVGVSKQNQKVKFIFNQRAFKFKYGSLKTLIERQIQGEIQKEGVTNAQIYPLIFQYLSFHGYEKTLNKLQESEIDFYKIPKLCKHPGITRPTIDLNSIQNLQINQDNQTHLPNKSALRNRYMSQRFDEQNFIIENLGRKNSQLMGGPERKSSFFENISNVSNHDNSYKYLPQYQYQEDKLEKQEMLDQNQKFLLGEKFQIINLIKDKQIQKALQIIQRKIPELLQQSQVVAFMKAHIFLRIVKEQSNLAAIAYSQKEKETFSSHKDTLFPFYTSYKDKVQWKPLKYIYNALAFNAKEVRKKWVTLSVTNNSNNLSLIHKKMGYLGCSRLAFLFNNTRKILEKIKDFKGMSCGLQLYL